jgi:hypothetical protein
MAVQIQIRRDTSSNWSSVNPVLASGEIGIETNTNKFKIGNGSSVWNSLVYVNALPSELSSASASLYATISSASIVVNSNALNYANSASAHVNVLAQGYANTAQSNAEATALGYANSASANAATVALGYANAAQTAAETTALGYANSASAHVNVLAQGYANTAQSNAEATALGYANSASAHSLVVSNAYTLSASSSLTSYINSKGIDKNNYTPTFSNDFTLGNGSYAAKYFETGDLNIVELFITLGSTSIIGNGFSFTLPKNIVNGAFLQGQYKSGNYFKNLSQKSISGSTVFVGFEKAASVYSTFNQLFIGLQNNDVDSSYLNYDEIITDQDRIFPFTSNLPRAKSSGDKIEILVTYEKSSV